MADDEDGHWAMSAYQRNPQNSHHRIFDSDAPQAAKVLFEAVCDGLDFEMDRSLCFDANRPMIQARGSEADQELIRRLRQKLGVTKNALLLTALRVGLDGIADELAEHAEHADGGA